MFPQLSDTTIRVMICCVFGIVIAVTLELTAIAIFRDGSSLPGIVSTLTSMVNDMLLVSGPIVGHMVGMRSPAARQTVTTNGNVVTGSTGSTGAGPSVPSA